jgi:hypothetical protein
MRRYGLGFLVAVFALAAAPSALGVILPPLPACGGATTTNCMLSVKLDGVTQPYPSNPGDPYQISAVKYPPGDYLNFSFNVDVNGGGWTLPSGGVWEVTLNTGGAYPGETFSRGRNVTIVRGGVAGSHTVRFTMQPVRIADQGCNSMGVCIAVAPRTFPGYLDGWVDDLDYITDPDDRAAMRGFDLSTNADWVSSPLQLDYDTNSIVLDAANSHFENDGTTVFVGEAEFRIPFAMLSRLYNVDDPASLTASAFSVTAPGASASTSVTVDTGSVKVELDGITFTKRRLRIHGDMTPRAPSVRARRTSSSTALLGFTRARPRGSKVRGYKATCRATGHTVIASSSHNLSPLRVRGLHYGTKYACTLRAKSHAGLGKIARIGIPRF